VEQRIKNPIKMRYIVTILVLLCLGLAAMSAAFLHTRSELTTTRNNLATKGDQLDKANNEIYLILNALADKVVNER
jgi:hypothetical protein